MTLADELEKRAPALAERLTELSWQDPFWQARFPERGRKFSDEDGRYHLKHVCESLRLGSPATLERYATWLQTVLTTRGMCSRHLAENFRALGRVIGEANVAEARIAQEWLEKAAIALRRKDGPAATLDERAAGLAAKIAPDARAEGETLVSYLADAVSLNRPEIFGKHVRWARGSGLYPRLDAQVRALAAEVASDAVLATATREAFEAAR